MVTQVSDMTNRSVQDSRLRQAVGELVNQVFYGTMLRQARASQRDPLLEGAPGGMAFVRQLDAELIKRMSRKADGPLVDVLVRKLSGHRVSGPAGPDGSAALIELDRAGQALRQRQLATMAIRTGGTHD